MNLSWYSVGIVISHILVRFRYRIEALGALLCRYLPLLGFIVLKWDRLKEQRASAAGSSEPVANHPCAISHVAYGALPLPLV